MTRDTARHIEVGGLGIASLAEECASSSRGLTPISLAFQTTCIPSATDLLFRSREPTRPRKSLTDLP